MAVLTCGYAGSTTTADTDRGPSKQIWSDCPIPLIVEQELEGKGAMMTWDDFTNTAFPALNAQGSMGQWSVWADTTSLLIDSSQLGSEGGIFAWGHGTTLKAFTLASTAGSYRFQSQATGHPLMNKMWFEARVAVGSIATGGTDLFVGLMDNTSTQVTASATGVFTGTASTFQTAKNYFGFYMASTLGTDFALVFNIPSGTQQVPTNLQTLVASGGTPAALAAYAAVSNGNPTGFVKLGWVFDPNYNAQYISSASSGQTAGNLARPLIRIFVNGIQLAAFLTSTNVQASTFPGGWMAPVIAMQNVSTSVKTYIDWIRVAQMPSY